MPIRRKIGLTLLFGVGVFGCVITSIKAYQLRNIGGHDNLTRMLMPLPLWCDLDAHLLTTYDQNHGLQSQCGIRNAPNP